MPLLTTTLFEAPGVPQGAWHRNPRCGRSPQRSRLGAWLSPVEHFLVGAGGTIGVYPSGRLLLCKLFDARGPPQGRSRWMFFGRRLTTKVGWQGQKQFGPKRVYILLALDLGAWWHHFLQQAPPAPLGANWNEGPGEQASASEAPDVKNKSHKKQKNKKSRLKRIAQKLRRH